MHVCVSVNFETFVFGYTCQLMLFVCACMEHVCKWCAEQAQDKLVDSELKKLKKKSYICMCGWFGLRYGDCKQKWRAKLAKPTWQSGTTLCHVPCSSDGIYKSITSGLWIRKTRGPHLNFSITFSITLLMSASWVEQDTTQQHSRCRSTSRSFILLDLNHPNPKGYYQPHDISPDFNLRKYKMHEIMINEVNLFVQRN